MSEVHARLDDGLSTCCAGGSEFLAVRIDDPTTSNLLRTHSVTMRWVMATTILFFVIRITVKRAHWGTVIAPPLFPLTAGRARNVLSGHRKRNGNERRESPCRHWRIPLWRSVALRTSLLFQVRPSNGRIALTQSN